MAENIGISLAAAVAAVVGSYAPNTTLRYPAGSKPIGERITNADTLASLTTLGVSGAPAGGGGCTGIDQTVTTTGLTTFTATCDGTLSFSTWGGGAGGGKTGQGGAGGGAFSSSDLAVSNGQVWNVYVAASAAAGSSAKLSFACPSSVGACTSALTVCSGTGLDATNFVCARGGATATGTNGAAGGVSAYGVGTTKFSGGNGGKTVGNYNGGGGGSAGPDGAGITGSDGKSPSGGAGGAGDNGSGGAGGAGGKYGVSAGAAGTSTFLGGGGGGGSSYSPRGGGAGGAPGGGGGSTTGTPFGAGGRGQVWINSSLAPESFIEQGNSSLGGGTVSSA